MARVNLAPWGVRGLDAVLSQGQLSDCSRENVAPFADGLRYHVW